MNFTKTAIYKKAASLYAKGYSLRAIATETGASKTAVRDAIMSAKIPLRTHSNGQIGYGLKPKVKSIKTAPYGYCLINGQLLEDPREMENVRLILKWSQEGLSLGAIARKLNVQGRRPRKASGWSQPTIGFIVKRQSKGASR